LSPNKHLEDSQVVEGLEEGLPGRRLKSLSKGAKLFQEEDRLLPPDLLQLGVRQLREKLCQKLIILLQKKN
jgi:hypothetical protein